MYKEV